MPTSMSRMYRQKGSETSWVSSGFNNMGLEQVVKKPYRSLIWPNVYVYVYIYIYTYGYIYICIYTYIYIHIDMHRKIF